MKIKLDDEYAIISDNRGFILGKFNKKTNDIKLAGNVRKYYSNIEDALKGYYNLKLKTTNAQGINEVNRLMEDIAENLEKVANKLDNVEIIISRSD